MHGRRPMGTGGRSPKTNLRWGPCIVPPIFGEVVLSQVRTEKSDNFWRHRRFRQEKSDIYVLHGIGGAPTNYRRRRQRRAYHQVGGGAHKLSVAARRGRRRALAGTRGTPLPHFLREGILPFSFSTGYEGICHHPRS